MDERKIMEMAQIAKEAEGLSREDMKNEIPQKLKNLENKRAVERGMIMIHQSVINEGMENEGLTYLLEKSAYNDFFMISGTQYALIRITGECYKVVDVDLVDSLAEYGWKYDNGSREPYTYVRLNARKKKVLLSQFIKYRKSGDDPDVLAKGMCVHHKWLKFCEDAAFLYEIDKHFHDYVHNNFITRQRMSGLYQVRSWEDLVFIFKEVLSLAPVMRKTWLTARF